MAKELYRFEYDHFSASASIEVDRSVFKPEMAKETLEFFVWDYDKDADPVQEALKKYVMQALKVGGSMEQIIDYFEDCEGFFSLSGKHGIELTDFEGYEFDEELLIFEKDEKN